MDGEWKKAAERCLMNINEDFIGARSNESFIFLVEALSPK